MRVDIFDFDLPPERIALHPAEPRDSARLLVVKPGGALADKQIGDLLDLLEPGDVLVVNDTRVIPAELSGHRLRAGNRASVAFNLHKRVDATTWRAFARPAKRLALYDRVHFGGTGSDALDATVVGRGEGGEVSLAFDLSGPDLDRAIERYGVMPLPAYIGTRRAADERDRLSYQTVYAANPGAVAAPTAGLHFTEVMLQRLAEKGIGFERLTLHVGAGTFLPVKVSDTDQHQMHSEWGEIDQATVERIRDARSRGGRVVAVGTTSLRLLESAARQTGTLQPFVGETDIFITPGFQFRAVDLLITNFHLPRSTLFMLVSAFSGIETMRRAYDHAIAAGYRFYSYGDACLLVPQPAGERFDGLDR